MNLSARFEAYIPPEPPALTIVVDATGRVWQRLGPGWQAPGVMGFRRWQSLIVDLGPLYPIRWNEDELLGETGELGGAPDTDDHVDEGVGG